MTETLEQREAELIDFKTLTVANFLFQEQLVIGRQLDRGSLHGIQLESLTMLRICKEAVALV